MKKSLLLVFVAVLAASGVFTVQAASKVQVCHLPPGVGSLPATANANAFHTITVTENNLASHLAHGDLAGSCSDSCDTLCDDGDACTVDHHNDCEENGCLITPEVVDCDDSLLCTNDSCDSQGGCQYAPIVCDDGDSCTIDACNPADGLCAAPPKDCGALGLCLSETGDCDYPCDGISCDPIDQCHGSGECVLPGDCVDGDALADGTACDDGDATTVDDQCSSGNCSGTHVVTCPCDFSESNLNSLFSGISSFTCFDWPGEAFVVTGYNGTDTVVGIVEFVSHMNIPTPSGGWPAGWPLCGAVASFAAYDPLDYTSGISIQEALVCNTELRAYGEQLRASGVLGSCH